MVDHYFKNFRLAYTLTPTAAIDKTTYNSRLQFSMYYTDTSYVTASGSFGEEVGLSAQGNRNIYNTRYIGVNGRHWISPDWALDWEFGHMIQGDAYNKNGIQVGIRRSF